MSSEPDDFQRQLRQTLDRSVEQLDADTRADLQRARARALTQAAPRNRLRPAMAVAASLVALVLVPWLALREPAITTPDLALHDDSAYLAEDPDMLATWDMLDAIGEVPDA